MTKQAAIVTKASLQRLLDDPAKRTEVIGRALVVLFERQLDDEKRDATTKVVNYKGFSSSDAKSGTIAAKTFLKRRAMRARGQDVELLPAFVIDKWMAPEKGQPRIMKYTRQLNDAAIRKAGAQ